MRISYSALNTYQTCPLKYKFKEIDKIKEPKSKEAVFGSVIHATMKFIHTPGILSPTLEQALDYFSKNWNSEIFKDEAEERAAFSQGVQIIQNYYQKNDPAKSNIVDLESRFEIEIGPDDNKHDVPGIIDRIDKTEDGYEVIDYKTTKKMPSQEKVDNDLQLSIYLQGFLKRYPKEAERLDKINVSLYYLKHGVKLSSQRTREQLQKSEQLFLDVIKEIESGKFEPVVSPLCGWCGYQDRCPMWKHKFKEQRKIDSEEINKTIEEYLNIKSALGVSKNKLAELQGKISQYMDQEGVERVFGEDGIIARTLRKTYKYDEDKLKAILEPLGKWNDVLKVNGVALRNILGSLPYPVRKDAEKTKTIDKESKSFIVKKK
ncbi:PD-(D/E)XK nuclease superfamily protein [bacterium BMS3Abin15]|nr:PD-(D/E)XK nuclease superfamily protein [bacterium BMS3Abin15]HDZ85065.1 PD-(D/E)XK nuclease family protein [Candidatus Moranbacteria bacterium]